MLTALHSTQNERDSEDEALPCHSDRQKMCIPTLQTGKHGIQLGSLGRDAAS